MAITADMLLYAGSEQESSVAEDAPPSNNDLSNPSEVLWSCDIRELPEAEGAEWMELLSILTDAEREKVTRFRLFSDQKRAFLSVQMQRCLIRSFTGLSSDDLYEIRRTQENKPYPLSEHTALGTWNYNVSHHGNYVAIASHPKKIIGVDVMTIQPTHRNAASQDELEFFSTFKAHFTSRELTVVAAQRSRAARYAMFFLIWSLKEAFVKAVGKGIAMDLGSADFDVSITAGALDGEGVARLCGTADMYLSGRKRADWSFRFFALDYDHIMSIGTGPLGEVVESYAKGAWRDVAKPKPERGANAITSNVEAIDDGIDTPVSVFQAAVAKASVLGPPTMVSHTRRVLADLLSPINKALLGPDFSTRAARAACAARTACANGTDSRADSK
jgi:4'-phosphopantetheinyl transferase